MNPVEKFLAEYSFVKTADPFSAAIPATLGGAALGAIDTYRRDDNDNKARDIIRSAMVTGGGAVAGSGLGRIVGTSIGRRTGNEALGGNAGENIGALAGALTGQQLAQYANRMNLSMLNGRPEKKKEKGKEAGAMVRVPSAGSARSAAGAVGDAVGDAAGAVGDSSGWAAPGGAANRVARKAIDPAKGFFARAKQIYNGDRIEDLKSVEQEAAKVHAPFAQQVADAKVPRDELAKKRQVAKDILKGKTLIRMPVRLEEAVRRNAARKLDATEDAFREAERNVADAAAKAAPYKGVHEGAANEVKNEVANQRLAQGAVKAGVIGIPTVGGIALAQHAINKSDEKAKKEARSKKKTASDLRYEDLMVRMKTAAWIGTAAKAAKGHRHFGGGTPAPEPEKVAWSMPKGLASGAKNLAGNFGEAVVTGLAGAAATGAVTGAGVAASHIYDAATKKRDFKNMMEFNPDLHEHHERDPRMFNQMFTSLRTMSPQFSKDPLVAGSYMRKLVDAPGSAGGILTDALGSSSKIPKSPMDAAWSEGASSAGRYMGETMKPNYALRNKVDKGELEMKAHPIYQKAMGDINAMKMSTDIEDLKHKREQQRLGNFGGGHRP